MLLAIDTSSNAGSVALCSDSGSLRELFLDTQVRSTRTLVPAIQELLNQQQLTINHLHAIAIVIGPGSFTGLRIGVTTAKMLAWATNLQLIPVLATDVLAAQSQSELSDTFNELEVLIDAQRSELFTARYKLLPDNNLQLVRDLAIQTYENWLQELTGQEIVTGPILTRISKKLPETVRLSANSQWNVRTGVVGKVALQRLKNGLQIAPLELKPLYIRPSYAEEVASQRH